MHSFLKVYLKDELVFLRVTIQGIFFAASFISYTSKQALLPCHCSHGWLEDHFCAQYFPQSLIFIELCGKVWGTNSSYLYPFS
jgi:hypothetical protein